MKGELHPTKNQLCSGLPHLVSAFLDIGRQLGMDLFVFWCGHFQRQQRGYYVTVSRVPYLMGEGGGRVRIGSRKGQCEVWRSVLRLEGAMQCCTAYSLQKTF